MQYDKLFEYYFNNTKGFEINHQYVAFMESILGAQEKQVAEETRKELDIWRKRSPTFVSMPENEILSFKEAAKILKLPEKLKILIPEDYCDEYSQEPEKIISIDEYDKNRRHSFIITDISERRHKTVMFLFFLFFG